MHALVNFTFFQIAWFACVLGGAHMVPWVGPLVVALVVGYHLQRAQAPTLEALLLSAAAVIGTVFDSILVASGWLQYPSGQWHALMAPYWIIAMWVAFATTLNVSLNWLKGRPLLSIVFGAIGGPLAYLAGSKLGGVTVVDPVWAYSALAVGWAVVTPLLVGLAGQLNGWRAGPRQALTTAAEQP
jgi:hypothetical protein